MSKLSKFLLFVLVLAVAGGGWVMYWREHSAFVTYMQQQIIATTLSQEAHDQTPALFESFDGTILHFKTPVQTVTATGTFVNYQEQIGSLDASTIVLDATGLSAAGNLQNLKPDTQLYLGLESDTANTGRFLVKTVYFGK